jgi:hypothetical protein
MHQLAVNLASAVANFLDGLLDRCTGLPALLRFVAHLVVLSTGHARTVLLPASARLFARHTFLLRTKRSDVRVHPASHRRAIVVLVNP